MISSLPPIPSQTCTKPLSLTFKFVSIIGALLLIALNVYVLIPQSQTTILSEEQSNILNAREFCNRKSAVFPYHERHHRLLSQAIEQKDIEIISLIIAAKYPDFDLSRPLPHYPHYGQASFTYRGDNSDYASPEDFYLELAIESENPQIIRILTEASPTIHEKAVQLYRKTDNSYYLNRQEKDLLNLLKKAGIAPAYNSRY